MIPKSASHLVGLTRIELVTSALSVLRSNQLSYSPANRLLTLHHADPGAEVEGSSEAVAKRHWWRQESEDVSPATGATAATASPSPRFITRTPVASRPWLAISRTAVRITTPEVEMS